MVRYLKYGLENIAFDGDEDDLRCNLGLELSDFTLETEDFRIDFLLLELRKRFE